MSELEGMEAGEHLAVYNLLVTQLQEGCRWVERWRTWQGDPDDVRPWSSGDCPGVQLVPQLVDDGWQDPATFRGRLVVAVEIALETYDVREAGRAWRAIKRVFYPDTVAAREDVRRAIMEKATGLSAGLVEFKGLTYTPPAAGALFIARGTLSVVVNEQLS